MTRPLVKIVGECPFCTRGNQDERNVLKILRNGKSEYKCGIGLPCVIVKLYRYEDESLGNADKETFY